jgi:hypothetical protein
VQKPVDQQSLTKVWTRARTTENGMTVHTFTVPADGARGTLRIRRSSPQAGRILADAMRVLKIA